jgi:methionine-S-sulfoxide reductase
MKLRLSEYNPVWKNEFTKLQTFLDSILTDLVTEIKHIGSTSVETLYAKPIIDIDIVYNKNFPEIKKILETNNYIYEGEKGIKDRHAFKRLKNDCYEHHLYVILENSENLLNHVNLKRALQNNQKHRNAYNNLKRQLIKENNIDRELYTESKTNLIQSILEEESLMKSLVLAGGCFWGVEAYFKQLDGVVDTEVGYINGNGTPTYQEVCAGSGHAEAILVKFDEDMISLKKILDHLFNIIDPTSINKQGNDVGIQYRSGIYNYAQEQFLFITNYINVRQKEYNRPITLELKTDLTFFPAEDIHQDYLEKNKDGYCHINLSSYKDVE